MLQTSGAISLNDVNVELGYAGTSQISLDDSAVRTLAGISSGAISMYDLYGKSNAVAENGSYFSAYYGTTYNFVGQSFTIDSNNYIYQCGGSGGIYKYDTNGLSVWGKYLTGLSSLMDIKTDSSGNIYVVGSTGLTKLNSSGVVQWSRTLSVTGGTQYATGSYASSGTWYYNYNSVSFYKCVVDSSGNVYAIGILSFNATPCLGYVVKYDSSGTFQYEYAAPGFGANPKATDCGADSSGNFYFCITAGDGYYGTNTIWKLNSSGTLVWSSSVSNLDSTEVPSTGFEIDESSGYFYLAYAATSSVSLMRLSLSSGVSPDTYIYLKMSMSNLFYGMSGGISDDFSIYTDGRVVRSNLKFKSAGSNNFYFYWRGGGHFRSNPGVAIAKFTGSFSSNSAWTRLIGYNLDDGGSYNPNSLGYGYKLMTTSAGNVVIGTSLNPNSSPSTMICKIPSDGGSSYIGNHGGYFTLDAPYGSTTTPTQPSSGYNNTIGYNSNHPIGISSVNGMTKSSASLSTSSLTVTRTNTNLSSPSAQISATGGGVKYYGNRKYHQVAEGESNTFTISSVPSGRSWDALIVAAGRVGTDGSSGSEDCGFGLGGSGGNGGAGGAAQLISASTSTTTTTASAGIRNTTGTASNSSGFGYTMTPTLSGGTGGNPSGTAAGQNGTAGLTSSIIGPSITFGYGGGGGGAGESSSNGAGSGGNSSLTYAGYGGGGGGYASNGANGSANYGFNIAYAGYGGGGGGGGGWHDICVDDGLSIGSGGYGGASTGGTVILAYNYN